MPRYKEEIGDLHADGVYETLPGNFVVGLEDVVKVVDCVREIATGVDARVEDGVELDYLSLIRVHCACFPISKCTFGARYMDFESDLRSRRGEERRGGRVGVDAL